MAGNAPHRAQITVFSGTLTTDVTNTNDATYTGRRIASLHPPYVLTMNVADSGTTQGGTTYVIAMRLLDSADGTTCTNNKNTFICKSDVMVFSKVTGKANAIGRGALQALRTLIRQ